MSVRRRFLAKTNLLQQQSHPQSSANSFSENIPFLDLGDMSRSRDVAGLSAVPDDMVELLPICAVCVIIVTVSRLKGSTNRGQ